MANPEKSAGERTGETVRNIGLVGAGLGILAMLAKLDPRVSVTLIAFGGGAAILGEAGRQIARRRNNPKPQAA
jgi:hypothetical protein